MDSETPKVAVKRRKPAAKKQIARPEPTREQITHLAEKYWAERGWPEGSPETGLVACRAGTKVGLSACRSTLR